DAQGCEKIYGHAGRRDRFGIIDAGKIEAVPSKRGHPFKGFALFSPVDKIRRRRAVELFFARLFIAGIDYRKTRRIAEREWSEQDGVDHGEDGGVCADTESQSNQHY